MSHTPTAIEPLSILIVDDELSIRKTLAICLETEGHRATAVSNQNDALTEASRIRFDLAFVDIRLGTDSGINLLPKLIEVCPWLKVVMITAHASVDSAVEAMRRGAFDYITKPFDVTFMTGIINKLLLQEAPDA